MFHPFFVIAGSGVGIKSRKRKQQQQQHQQLEEKEEDLENKRSRKKRLTATSNRRLKVLEEQNDTKLVQEVQVHITQSRSISADGVEKEELNQEENDDEEVKLVEVRENADCASMPVFDAGDDALKCVLVGDSRRKEEGNEDEDDDDCVIIVKEEEEEEEKQQKTAVDKEHGSNGQGGRCESGSGVGDRTVLRMELGEGLSGVGVRSICLPDDRSDSGVGSLRSVSSSGDERSGSRSSALSSTDEQPPQQQQQQQQLLLPQTGGGRQGAHTPNHPLQHHSHTVTPNAAHQVLTCDVAEVTILMRTCVLSFLDAAFGRVESITPFRSRCGSKPLGTGPRLARPQLIVRIGTARQTHQQVTKLKLVYSHDSMRCDRFSRIIANGTAAAAF